MSAAPSLAGVGGGLWIVGQGMPETHFPASGSTGEISIQRGRFGRDWTSATRGQSRIHCGEMPAAGPWTYPQLAGRKPSTWNAVLFGDGFVKCSHHPASNFGIDNVYYFGRLKGQDGGIELTYLTRSADDRPRLHSSARRPRSLRDVALTLTFFLSVAFAAAFVLGLIGH